MAAANADHKRDVAVIDGPGIWHVIHTQALRATTAERKAAFVQLIEDLIQDLRCAVCKAHAQLYVKANPIKDYLDITMSVANGHYQLAIGAFKWSWMFHNVVNKRLGKPILDWNTVYSLYKHPETCVKHCGRNEIVVPASEVSIIDVSKADQIKRINSNPLIKVKPPLKLVSRGKF